MPVVESQFFPPLWLRNGHAQTILGALLPRRLSVPWKRERLELDDGDFLDLDWLRHGRERVAILSHGLEGNSRERYNCGLGAALVAAGWDVLAWNFRGCGGEPNRALRFYHSGETGDLGAVVRQAAASYSRIALVGVSLGGNVTLKYLGESPPHPAVVVAAAISVPIDLAACVQVIDERLQNRIYLRRFTTSLSTKIETKARQFPGTLDARGVRSIAGLRAFDERYTAPIHGFRDATDYYAKSSAAQFLPGIAVPTLLLNARNDPFLAPAAFPSRTAEDSATLFLETPDSGGHMGFLDLSQGAAPWWERRVTDFLRTHL